MLVLDFASKPISELLATPTASVWQESIILFLQEFHNQKVFTVQSSGSTGKPKEFTFPKELLVKSALMTSSFLNLKKHDTALLCLPIQYIAGKMMLVRAYTLGLKLYCIEPKIRIALDQNFHFAAMTPMQAEKSIDSLSKIEKLLLGGMPIHDELQRKLVCIPTEMYETFGMTETLSHIALKRISETEKYFTILPEIEISTTKNGCLVIKSPFSEKPLQTNDIVKLIDKKHFIWKGRLDNMINSGGIKIFAEVIEKKLASYLSVPFYITSKKNPNIGEEVMLVIESNRDLHLAIQELIPENILTKHEFPKVMVVQKRFNRTKSGKIIREKF